MISRPVSSLSPASVQFSAVSAAKTTAKLGWAESFFTLPDRFSRYADSHWINPKSPVPRQKIGQFSKWFTSQWLQHDYTDVKGIPALGMGRHVVMPPIGAVAIIVIITTLAARIHYGLKRSKNNDSRELGDILRRDIPTLGLLVFAQEPLVQGMTKLIEDRYGIQLLAKKTAQRKGLWRTIVGNVNNHELTYSELDRYYRISHAKRLSNILQNTNNHQGILQVLNDTAIKQMTHQQETYFGEFTKHIRNGIRQAKRNNLSDNVVSKAYHALKQFEQVGLRSKNTVNIRTIFSDYAKNARHGSVFFSLAIIVGLLGYGVTRFNEWWSIHQYTKLLREEHKAFQAHRHN